MTQSVSTHRRKKNAPLIVLTNDDGIQSPGLRALARAVMPLGDVLIVAPLEQQSSMGRAFLGRGDAASVNYVVDGKRVRAFAVPTSPAVTARHAFLLLADRPPALLISGINYGENIGNGVTISGTVGAALEGANLGAPALAISVVTAPEFHMSHSDAVDFSVAAHFAAMFARRILARGLPAGVDVLNVNVPQEATESTPWRWTRVSRAAYFYSKIEETPQGKQFTGYESRVDLATLERDADVRAVIVDCVVSVSPLTLDLTARVAAKERARWSK
ncbi:MAG: 5'/3'-nucleotidase SurE [Chloroflexi bacterium]|nr:5'/3'-nucleotidase SurE [Chloroflexota bacterium]